MNEKIVTIRYGCKLALRSDVTFSKNIKHDVFVANRGHLLSVFLIFAAKLVHRHDS